MGITDTVRNDEFEDKTMQLKNDSENENNPDTIYKLLFEQYDDKEKLNE